jgi:hypothetical protein
VLILLQIYFSNSFRFARFHIFNVIHHVTVKLTKINKKAMKSIKFVSRRLMAVIPEYIDKKQNKTQYYLKKNLQGKVGLFGPVRFTRHPKF